MTKALVVLTLGGIGASATHAFASESALDGPPARGEGQAAISGYAVSDVRYTLDGADPTRFRWVEFALDAPARSVSARVSGSADHSSCSLTAAGLWRCPIDELVSDADLLTVIATG